MVVLAESDGLDVRLGFEHWELIGAHRDDVSVPTREEREFVPGCACDDAGVELLLPLHNHPRVVHVIPHRVRSEGETYDLAFPFGGPRPTFVLATSNRYQHKRGERGHHCPYVTGSNRHRRTSPGLTNPPRIHQPRFYRIYDIERAWRWPRRDPI